MRLLVALVLAVVSASQLGQRPADCWPLRDGLASIHGHVSRLISNFVEPFKQSSGPSAIRAFWNSDQARPMRDKFAEYKLRAFERFADAFKRRYNQSELPERARAFMQTYSRIESWHRQYQQGNVSFDLAVNHLADLTQDELRNLNKLEMPANYSDSPSDYSDQSEAAFSGLQATNSDNKRRLALPSAWNWRHWLPKVRNQADCGSCYAFATADVVGVAKSRADRDLSWPNKLFSAQQLVDCSPRDSGCSGGWPSRTLDYIKSAGGLAEDADYPYTARHGACSVSRLASKPALRKTPQMDYQVLTSEAAFERHIALHGPVVAAIRASELNFSFYKSGIFDDPSCGSRPWNHAVVVAGYGRDSGQDYWLIRNSYGDDWGESGYMRLVKGKNLCKIGLMGWGVVKV